MPLPPLIVAVTLLTATLTACASSSATATVVGRAGSIEVIHPFLPAPASPDVAAFYVTLRNTGHASDALVGASSSVAGSATMHAETTDGDMEMMTPLSRITIPAGRSVTLAPGHDHVMLEGLRTPVHQGQKLDVTLRFARAGTVSVVAPVVPLGTMSSMGGM